MDNRFIQKLKGYVDLPQQSVEVVRRLTAQPRKFSAGRDLIREGDKPGPLFVVLEGWAYRYKILPNGLRQITAFLLPGDACDLNIGMLAEMDHSIQAATPCRVAVVPRDDIDLAMDDHPKLARAMYMAQLADEGTLRAWIVSMGRRTSIERVAHLMCELYIRAQWIGLSEGDMLELPLSQILLADALGMTPVHINRMFRQLRTDGAVDVRRGHIRITNPAILVDVAGFDENYLHRRLGLTSS